MKRPCLRFGRISHASTERILPPPLAGSPYAGSWDGEALALVHPRELCELRYSSAFSATSTGHCDCPADGLSTYYAAASEGSCGPLKLRLREVLTGLAHPIK